ncbi:Helix-turn-helix domain protein [compost metagenome]
MIEIYSRKEAAKAAGVSPRTILRAIQARQLDAVKIGNGKTSTYVIERDDLMKYTAKRKERKCQ